MVNNTETKVPLNINWDSNKNIWHIMVLSAYVEHREKTLVASCQYKHDTKKTFKNKLYRDWLNRSLAQFPDGKFFKDGTYSNLYIDLNLDMICSKCIKQVKNIEEFKTWLIVQKLKYL